MGAVYKLKHADLPPLQRTPVSTPARSIIAIITMTAEGPDMDPFRVSYSGENEGNEEIPFLVVSYILWLVFVVVMPILLINMLVSSEPAHLLSGALQLVCLKLFIDSIVIKVGHISYSNSMLCMLLIPTHSSM